MSDIDISDLMPMNGYVLLNMSSNGSDNADTDMDTLVFTPDSAEYSMGTILALPPNPPDVLAPGMVVLYTSRGIRVPGGVLVNIMNIVGAYVHAHGSAGASE